MVTVKISEKDGQQTTYQFDKPEISIGRMKGNDIVLPKGNVSKKHARLIRDGGNLKVDDLNSTNGTYVNGRKVTAQTDVSEDDKIYIGDFILQLRPEGEADAQQGPPSPPGADSKQPSGAGGGPTNPPPSGSRAGDSSGGGSSRPKPPSGGSRPGSTSQSGSVDGGTPSKSPPSPADSASQKPTQRDDAVDSKPGSSSGPKSSGAGSSLDERFSSDGSSGGGPDSPSPESHRSGGSGGSGGSQSAGGPSSSGPSQRPSTGGPDRDAGTPARGSSTGPPVEQSSDDEERPSVDQARGRSPVSQSVGLAPKPLTDEFDESLHSLHREAASALLDAIGGVEEFPVAYPAPDDERDALVPAVSKAVGSVDAGSNADALEEVLIEEAVGLGPVEQLLDDPDVDAIYVNDFDRVITRRGDDIVRESIAFGDPEFLLLAAKRLLGGREAAHSVDRVRFSDGTTARVVVPPVAMHGPALSIECPVGEVDFQTLTDQESLTGQMADFLKAAVVGNQTVLVVGPDDNSRRQVLSALCADLPDAARTVGVSDAEIATLERPTATQLDASPGDGWDRAEVMEAAQQLNPDRLVVDELQGSEVAGWVRGAVTGGAGSIATIYGQNLEDGLDRLYAAGQSSKTSGGPIDRTEVATAVDIAVVVSRSGSGPARIVRIAALEDVDYDRFRLTDVFTFREEDDEAEFVASGFVPSFYEALSESDASEIPADVFSNGS